MLKPNEQKLRRDVFSRSELQETVKPSLSESTTMINIVGFFLTYFLMHGDVCS